jgi:hypothetical protein
MRHVMPGLTLAGIGALLLVACGGGGRGGSSSGGTANIAPVANAGPNQTVISGVVVTLNGTASTDSDGNIASYSWTQISGSPTVTLTNGTSAQPTFTAPAVVAATTLGFSLLVTDNRGLASVAATMIVTINPLVVSSGNVTGLVTFARVPFSTSAPIGLDYAAPVQQVARGVTVRALAAGTGDVLDTTSTNDLGIYTLDVGNNTNVTIEVVATMLRDDSQSLPRWDVRVQDGVAGTPYTYSDGVSFNPGALATHDVAIPTGISATGTATGPRASGPFAILDSIYRGMQTIIGVAPFTDFPALIVDWGSQADGTFFSSGTPQFMALLSALNSDTDEFDAHVIAHEFGHYIEHNFSRADSIGGAHGLGDRLDIRVAFGEGFGSAFAAIVLNDPNFRDSRVDNGVQGSGFFNVELNPATNSPATPGDGLGCYCSESSVWSILWDLYDGNPDANDNLSLGFAPIWAVLIGPQRTTPAFTSIFSFVSALKAQRPADAASINTLVAAQNIDSATINAFATTETHTPGNNLLPLYATITAGIPLSVLSLDNLGRHNKIGNHRLLRFTPTVSGPVNVSVVSSNPNNADPDFFMMQAGDYLLFENEPPPQPEVGGPVEVTAGTTYVLDVHDCANGCSGEQGTAGDYDLTVTIN